jgi:uncharacterized protein (TIGR02444 family)
MRSSRDRAGGALWAFATAFYQRPMVEAALLDLQDQDGLDVPLLIALVYAGTQGIVLDDEMLGDLCGQARAWESRAIAPLRTVRRALRPDPGNPADPEHEALRAQVKAAELAAERLLLDRLETRLPGARARAPGDSIGANLKAYARQLEPPLSAAGAGRLERLAHLAKL